MDFGGHPVRLLFVVNGHEYTAAHRLPLLRAARAAGFDVRSVAPDGSPAAGRLQREGFHTHLVRLSRRGLRIWEEWRAVQDFVRVYREVAPDLIHHATIKPVIYGTLAARWAGRPAVVNAITGLGYVYTDTDRRSRVLRRGVDVLYRNALRYSSQRIIFQNRDDLSVLQGIGAVDPEQVVLIPGSGVDVVTYVPAPEAAGEPVVVLPARLIRDKGIEEFVAAARAIHARGLAARFVLVGGLDMGNPAGIRERDVLGWVEEGVVEWWGQVNDMRTVYESAHVVVLPSYREGLPKVLLEAGASGRPVVTTTAPGCRDAVVDGESGYLVPVRDSAALAERIGDLLVDPELRRRMGRAGRVRVESEFSTERVVKDTLDVYESLLSRRRDKSSI